jgi:predicted CXXCH cytochrome family protein
VRWILLLVVFGARAAEPGYVDPAACKPCHPAIFESYQRTGMGRSFAKVTGVPPLAGYLHRGSQRNYSVATHDGAWFLQRTSPLFLEKRIDYTIGSGNHSRTYAHSNEQGRLIELPLSWYAEDGGVWRMSPGYDRADHADFRREISDSCLFCHNGYPSAANGGLAQGIDCQRCHGPGERHIGSKGTVVNPAKLTWERQIEVCLQCHLESASRTLPDSMRRFGRTQFSYRPGEPLGDFTLYFEFAKGVPDKRITVNGSAYGLMKSRCFLQSAGRMTCTTCHDPHRTITGAEAEVHYSSVCRSCHSTAHESARRDCTGCHMQKRRTEDAVHVVMTDHLIRRKPLAGDLVAPIPERHGRLTGPVKLLYPPKLPDTPETRLYLAMAESDVSALEDAIRAARPAESEPYFRLGEALRKVGRTAEAISAFRRAIDLSPADSRGYVAASELMLATGGIDASIALLRPALLRMPKNAAILNSLAIVYSSNGRFDEALPLLTKAVELSPDDPLSWLNLGVCREAKGDLKGAARDYRRSLVLQPDFVRAREYLKRVGARK